MHFYRPRKVASTLGVMSLLGCEVLIDGFQVCLAFGECKLRKNEQCMLIFVRLTYSNTGKCLRSHSFLCFEYWSSTTYVHIASILSCQERNLRSSSLIVRCSASSNSMRNIDEWDVFQVPRIRNEDVEMWHVFLRRALSSEFRTLSVISLGMRKKVERKATRRRL